MSTLILVNIGNSDLRADGKRIDRPRPDGQRLFEEYSDHTFALPIVEPCIREILRHAKQIDRLILYITDQPDTAETRALDRYGVALRDKDTIWAGKIAARILGERYADQIAMIDIVAIERANGSAINPSMYDEAFDAYGELVGRSYTTGADCYVLMAGGIPACNTALQLQAISAYAGRCHTMYQPEGSVPYELRVGTQVLATFQRATAISALEQRHFAAALTLLDGIAHPALIELVRYAHLRECFDFERAQQALEVALRAASGELRQFIQSLRGDLDNLMAREDIAALIHELVANAEIAYRNGRYADFLGRIFRFQEATLRAIIETKLGLPTDMSKEKEPINGPAFRAGIAANPALQALLDATKLGDKPLRYDTPNIPTLQALLKYLVAPDSKNADGTAYFAKGKRERYEQAKKRLDKITGLSQLRNQSVIAHGFAGVSRELLATQYGSDPDGLVADLKDIMRFIDLPVPPSPFDTITDTVIAHLRRGGS
jgi:hypothetical protein